MGRRETDIYGDYYGDLPSNRFPEHEPQFVNEDFRIEWPAGYWEEYDRLRVAASRLSNDSNILLVMRLNGKFQVRTSGLSAQNSYEIKYTYGPEQEGRLEAWAAFIDSISTGPTQALKELVGKALKINVFWNRRVAGPAYPQES